jgi:hypothetical protein
MNSRLRQHTMLSLPEEKDLRFFLPATARFVPL